jgi:hypothetical protein
MAMAESAAWRAPEPGLLGVRAALARIHRAVRATPLLILAAESHGAGQGIAQPAQLYAEHHEQELKQPPEHRWGFYTGMGRLTTLHSDCVIGLCDRV